MDEATQIITPQPSTVIAAATTQAQRQTMNRAVRVEAMRRAKGAIKRAYQAQGVKIARIPYRQIVAAAKAYLAKHPELIAEAKEVVERWHAEGMFGKRGGFRVR
jgi:hypothetical protein